MGTTEPLPQTQYRTEREGPTVRKLIASGERRLVFLDEMIDEERGSRGALQFAKAERLFVRAGLLALRTQHALLREDTSPIVALQDLLGELELLGVATDDHKHDRLRGIVARSRSILRELGVVPE